MIKPPGSGPISPSAEKDAFLLFVEPAQEFLKTRISLDFLDSVEGVFQFVMRPGLVDEIFARMASRRRFFASLTTWNDMVPSRGHIALAEDAAFDHITELIFPSGTQPFASRPIKSIADARS